MKRILTVAIIVALLYSVGLAAEGHDYWTILPRREAEEMRKPCSRPFPKGLGAWWEPSESEVERAEKKLSAAIDAAFARLPRAEDRRRRPEQYYRQYAGFIRNGKRVLYVNAVKVETNAGRRDDSWRNTYSGICDGGTSAFGTVYELQKDSFDSFFFSGRFEGPVPGGGWTSLD